MRCTPYRIQRMRESRSAWPWFERWFTETLFIAQLTGSQLKLEEKSWPRRVDTRIIHTAYRIFPYVRTARINVSWQLRENNFCPIYKKRKGMSSPTTSPLFWLVCIFWQGNVWWCAMCNFTQRCAYRARLIELIETFLKLDITDEGGAAF